MLQVAQNMVDSKSGMSKSTPCPQSADGQQKSYTTLLTHNYTRPSSISPFSLKLLNWVTRKIPFSSCLFLPYSQANLCLPDALHLVSRVSQYCSGVARLYEWNCLDTHMCRNTHEYYILQILSKEKIFYVQPSSSTYSLCLSLRSERCTHVIVEITKPSGTSLPQLLHSCTLSSLSLRYCRRSRSPYSILFLTNSNNRVYMCTAAQHVGCYHSSAHCGDACPRSLQASIYNRSILRFSL